MLQHKKDISQSLSILTIITTTLFLFPHTHSQSNSILTYHHTTHPKTPSPNPPAHSVPIKHITTPHFLFPHSHSQFHSYSSHAFAIRLPHPISYSLPRTRNPFHRYPTTAPPFIFPLLHSQTLSSLTYFPTTLSIPSPSLSFPNYPSIAIAALSAYVPRLFYFSSILYFSHYIFPPRCTTLQLMPASARCLSNFQCYPPLCFAAHNSPSHSRRSSTPRVFSNLVITSIAFTHENVLQVFQATK
jgi:hypothetical protein